MAESSLERQNGKVQNTQSNAAQPLGAWAPRLRLMHNVIKRPTPPQYSNIESALIYAYFMSGVIKKTLSNINNIIFFVFCAKFCNIICTFAVWKQIAKCMHFYRECERVMVCDWDRERLYYCISYLFPKCSLGSMVLLILLYLKSDALHIYNVHANVTHSVWIWL